MDGYLLHPTIAVLALAGSLALAGTIAAADAQSSSPSTPIAPAPDAGQPNLTRPNGSTNGPAGTAVQTRTSRSLYSNGAEVDTSQDFQKTQSYSSGGGALSAHTHIQSTGPVTTVKPPSSSQEIPQ
jgi:hypothetical protein